MEFDTHEIDDATTVIQMTGRLDIDGTHAVDNRFAFAAATRKHNVIVDLSGISFLASIGIRMLITNARGQQGRGGKFVLAAPTETVRKVLEIAGIDQLIPLHDTVAAALAAIGEV
jgi:anti-anti-sigma factor